MALVLRALNPRSLALLFDLVLQVMAVTIDAESVSAAHSIRRQIIPFLAANIAHEPGHKLGLGRPARSQSQPRFLQYFVRIVHVRFDQPLFVPMAVAQEDGDRLRGEP